MRLVELRICAQRPADFVAVAVRHHRVQDDDLGPVLADALQRSGSVGGGGGFDPAAAEREQDQLENRLRIICDDDRRGHGYSAGGVVRGSTSSNVAPPLAGGW